MSAAATDDPPRGLSVSERIRALPLFRRIGYQPPEVLPLDAAALAALGSLPLRARCLVEASGIGRHRSRRRGTDVEFADYRDYQIGDDLRRIDWRLYARTDRLHIREANADTPLRLVLLLDVSPSMAYVGEGRKRLSKLDYARALLGALALLARRQRDACGVGLLAENLIRWLPPGFSPARIESVWSTLDAPIPGEGTALAAALNETLEVAPRRCLFVLASDFYEEPAAIAPIMQRLRSEGHDLIALRVLDPVEIEFPFKHPGAFVDLETAQELKADPPVIRANYQAAFARHSAELGEAALAHGAELIELRTDELPLDTLRNYLAQRVRRAWRR